MHLYVIEFQRRDKLLSYLQEKGVGASLHYPLAVHQQAAYKGRIHGHDDLPLTEQFYKRHLTLPLYPELPDHITEMIISEVLNFFKDY
jgi:dTDP-4-amino-4,6-dideoxygalactose transaminase